MIKYSVHLDQLLWSAPEIRSGTPGRGVSVDVTVASYDGGPPRVRLHQCRRGPQDQPFSHRTIGSMDVTTARAVAAQLVEAAAAAEQLGATPTPR